MHAFQLLIRWRKRSRRVLSFSLSSCVDDSMCTTADSLSSTHACYRIVIYSKWLYHPLQRRPMRVSCTPLSWREHQIDAQWMNLHISLLIVTLIFASNDAWYWQLVEWRTRRANTVARRGVGMSRWQPGWSFTARCLFRDHTLMTISTTTSLSFIFFEILSF